VEEESMWKSTSLKTQFIVIICAVTLVLVGILSAVIISTANTSQSEQAKAFIASLQSEQEQEEELLRQGLTQKVKSLAGLLAQTASYLIMNYNFELLQQLADNVTGDPEVDFVTFYGEDEEPLTKEADQREDIETIRQEILEGDNIIGFVEIGYNWERIDKTVGGVSERIEKLVQETETKRAETIRGFTLRILIFAVIGVVLLSLIISLNFSHLITKPLLTVSDTARQLAEFDLTVNINTNRKDEIGMLLTSIQEMVYSFRKVIGQVQKSGIQVTSSATELSATAKEQDAIMVNQVESTNNVVKSVQGISDIAGELVQTMQEVASMSQETAGFASSGQTDLARMEEAMQHMEDASKAISGRLQAISEKADNITNVVTTITKVADQTNLLSLNAAIEAEKAGEYGRGFTVVAREIRRLADQTAVATLDIEQMVQEMQSAVSAGVMEMDKFIAEVRHSVEDVEKISLQLTRIIEQVQALSPSFEDVNEAMQFQSGSAQAINKAMLHLSEEMQQTRDSLHETYSAIEQLNEAARSLQDEVSRFRLTNVHISVIG
jgi:methyl-accepting chemotaxis protein WspA